MLHRFVRAFAAMLFTLMILTRAALAQDGGSTDIKAETLARLKELRDQLAVCQGDLKVATGAQKDLDAKLSQCLAEKAALEKAPKPAPAAPAAPKPVVKYACLGVEESLPQQVGNDCACGNPDYSAEVEGEKFISPRPAKRCMPNKYRAQEAREIVKQLQPLCSDPRSILPENQAKEPAFCKEVWNLIISKFPDLQKRVDDLEDALCPQLPENPGAPLSERCRPKPVVGRVNLDFHVDGGVFGRGPGGLGFLSTASIGIGFYPEPSWRVSPEAEFTVGQFVGGNVNGPITTIGGSFGLRFDLTANRALSLHLALQDIQSFSDHEAGYLNGALRTQGMGNALGGGLGLRHDWHLVDLRLRGFVGDGAVNTFPGGNVLAEAKAIQFTVGLGVGIHVPILGLQ